jgi:Leucine-rich repeat (LRR) protein
LVLNYNKVLTTLPKEISKCKELSSLYLSGTQISEEEIGEIKKLLPECGVSN